MKPKVVLTWCIHLIYFLVLILPFGYEVDRINASEEQGIWVSEFIYTTSAAIWAPFFIIYSCWLGFILGPESQFKGWMLMLSMLLAGSFAVFVFFNCGFFQQGYAPGWGAIFLILLGPLVIGRGVWEFSTKKK